MVCSIATTREITLLNRVKKSWKKFKWYTGNSSLKQKKALRRRKGTKKDIRPVENKSKMADLNLIISIILNVNRLNNLIKLQRLSDWIKKQDVTVYSNIQIDWK